jgi:hypothetical protein
VETIAIELKMIFRAGTSSFELGLLVSEHVVSLKRTMSLPFTRNRRIALVSLDIVLLVSVAVIDKDARQPTRRPFWVDWIQKPAKQARQAVLHYSLCWLANALASSRLG